MSLVLIVRSPGNERSYPLDRVLSVGRGEDNDVILASAEVSRHHARIGPIGFDLQVVDLGSANGTFVEGTRLEPRAATVLRAGQRVAIGQHSLAIDDDGPSAATIVSAATVIAAAPNLSDSTVVVTRPVAGRLHIVSPGGTREVELSEAVTTLGRGPANSIVVDEAVVSQNHCIIRRIPGGYQVEDRESSNGLFAGGERVTTHILKHGDELTIGGTVRIRYVDETPAAAPPHAMPKGALELSGKDLVTIGRNLTNDIVVDHPTVSRLHARVVRTANGDGAIEDMESSNGTFLNGQRVLPGQPRTLTNGDTIQVGNAAFSYNEGALAQTDRGDGLELRVEALHQVVARGVDLLQGISLAIRPREFVAVVGASGAGKSMLLGALSGYKPASSGTVLVNGRNLYEEFDAFRTSMGYVPQEDILHKELPVGRALSYAAELRLPGDTTAEERAARVADVLKTLGLEDRADIPIEKLSGGQRKRVSIGAELITNPGLFFLDEATSGLDPGTEGQLMRLLRQLADDGRTIILITHATKNVMLCDKVVFLAKGGHLAFFGPPDEALTHFGVADFDGIYDQLESGRSPAEWAERFRASPGFARTAGGAAGTTAVTQVSARRPERAAVSGHRASGWQQFRVLSRRYLDIMLRDRLNLMILLLAAPIAAMINLIAWPGDVLSFETGDSTRALVMAYMLSLMLGLIGSIIPVREIVKERAVYARERAVALQVLPYVASKAAILGLFALYHAAAMFLITMAVVDIPGGGLTDYASIYVTFGLTVVSGTMLGLLVSGVSPRDDQAVLLVIAVVLIQIVFSGGILPLGDLGPAGTVVGSITSANWAFKGAIAAFDVHRGVCTGDLSGCLMPGFSEYTTPETRDVAMRPINDRYADVFGADLVVVWAALIALTVVTFAALWFVQRRKGVV